MPIVTNHTDIKKEEADARNAIENRYDEIITEQLRAQMRDTGTITQHTAVLNDDTIIQSTGFSYKGEHFVVGEDIKYQYIHYIGMFESKDGADSWVGSLEMITYMDKQYFTYEDDAAAGVLCLYLDTYYEAKRKNISPEAGIFRVVVPADVPHIHYELDIFITHYSLHFLLV